jgi:hypothetical protein
VSENEAARHAQHQCCPDHRPPLRRLMASRACSSEMPRSRAATFVANCIASALVPLHPIELKVSARVHQGALK